MKYPDILIQTSTRSSSYDSLDHKNMGFLIPEILDEILEYIYYSIKDEYLEEFNRTDIFACLLVNHQFYSHALPLLYRDVSLFSTAWDDRNKDEEDQIWEQIRNNLTCCIHNLKVYLRRTAKGDSASFIRRVEYIVERARNLQSVDVTIESQCDHHALESVFNALKRRKNQFELTFHLGDQHNPSDALDSVTGGKLLWGIRTDFKVTSIALTTHGSSMKLQFLLGFHHLRELHFYDHGFQATTTIFDATSDLDDIFNNIPLQSLHISVDLIKTLPRTVKVLDIRGWNIDITLKQLTWAAICQLSELQKLDLLFSNITLWHYEPCRFQSTKLRSLSATLGAASASTLQSRIFQPIFDNNPFIKTLNIELEPAPLNTPLLQCFFASSRFLVSLQIHGNSNPYILQDVVKCGNNLPHLTMLKIPLSYNIHEVQSKYEFVQKYEEERRDDYDAENLAVIWCERERELDVPVPINIRECRQLAMMCPKLKYVEFRIDIMEPRDRIDMTNFSPSSDFQIYSSEIGGVDIQPYLRRLQSYKMSRYVDPLTPCLNICTLLYHFNNGQKPFPSKRDEDVSLVLILSLDHVQKHDGHLYFPQFLPLTEIIVATRDVGFF